MAADMSAPGFDGEPPETEVRHLRRQLAAAEQRARAGEDRYRTILNSAVDYAVIALDLGGLVTEWNEGARRILGWTEVEMLGRPATVFFTEEDREARVPEAEMDTALREGRGADERWHQRKDGSRFWANGEMMPLRDAAGTLQGFIKVLRDRTGQHRAAEKNRADAEFMRSVLASSSDCIKVLDLDARLTFMSEGGQRVMEVDDFNAIHGCPWPDFWRHQGNEDAKAAVAAARAGGTGHFRGMADTVAGTPRWWDVRVTPMFGTDGRPERLLVVSRDITATYAAETALRASEEHWRGLFERLQEGLVIGGLIRDQEGRTVDWRYLDVNPAWADLVGLEQAGTVGRTIREMFPGIEESWVQEPARVVDTGEPAIFTRQVGGLGRWYEGRTYPLGADRFTIIFQEVTERRQISRRAAAMLALTDRLREDAEPAALALAGCEIIGQALEARRVGYGAVGADGETFVVDRDWTAPGVPSLAGTYVIGDYVGYAEALRRGEIVVITDTREDARTAGTAAMLDALSVRALVNLPITEDGRIVAILYVNDTEPRTWLAEDVAFARDAAERLRLAIQRRTVEARLRTSEGQLRIQSGFVDTLIRQAPIGISITEAGTGNSIVLNDKARALLGQIDCGDGLGRYRYYGAVHADGRPYAPEDYPTVRALRDGVAIENEEMIYRRAGPGLGADDDTRRLEVSSTPILDAAERVVAAVTVFFDVEEQRQAADLLRTVNEELARRVAAEVAERAKTEDQLRQSQKMEAVGQLTGGLAHDFNNLLTGVLGSLELMSTRISQGRFKDVDRYVSAAQGAARRAAALTHRLLAFSRQQTLDPKPTDVNRLIAGMEDLVRRTVGPAVAVEVVGAGGLWPTLVDPPQLENALLNLCINARDAMPGGGRITVETANKWLDQRAAGDRDLPPGQYVSLCVTDTGTGIPPEVVARIFDPFFTTKPLGQGTGLGLSMVYGFVRQSGGQVRVYSEIGQGTTMCLYLPRHHGQEAGDEERPGQADTSRAEQGETVLVVDDEPTVRMLVTEVLEDLGYIAIEAADGAGAMRVLRSDARIDLLVTDVGLPGGMNGRQVADAARVVRPALKVLFITGYAENAATGNGHLDPGMELLTKPFAMHALASRIKGMIGRT